MTRRLQFTVGIMLAALTACTTAKQDERALQMAAATPLQPSSMAPGAMPLPATPPLAGPLVEDVNDGPSDRVYFAYDKADLNVEALADRLTARCHVAACGKARTSGGNAIHACLC